MKKTPAARRINIATLSLRKLTLADVITLEKVGVKLFEQQPGAAAPSISIGDGITIIYLLSQPAKDIVALRANPARLEAAVMEFAECIEPDQFGVLTEKLMRSVSASFGSAKPDTSGAK